MSNLLSRRVSAGAAIFSRLAAAASRLTAARRVGRLALALSALTLAAVVLVAAPALALDTHVFSQEFGSSGGGAGQVALAGNSGVAVDAVTHDVYVADTNNFRVDQFSSAGVFVRAWGWGVADGLPGFETCTLACQPGLSGAGTGQFSAPSFVAVDNSGGASAGDVYVGDAGTNTVSKFSASGAYISTIDGSSATAPVVGPFGGLAGVAVDGSGDLWVYDTTGDMFEFAQNTSFITDWNSGRGVTPNGIDLDSAGNLYVLTAGGSVEQFTSAGTDVGPVNGDASNPTGLAVDRSTSDVYMDSGGVLVRHYPSACGVGGNCTAADTFGSGRLSGAAGLAVDSSDGTVYAADTAGGQFGVFAAATLPDVTTSPATGVALGGATLHGQVDPAGGGDITGCHFQYVSDSVFQATGFADLSGAGSIACEQATPISAPAAVSATVTGLPSTSVYHFRLVAANASGANAGAEQSFTTAGPAVDDTSVSAVTSSSAELGAQVNPNLQATTYHFQYGTSTAYGQRTAESALTGSDFADHSASAHIQGLAANTAYHFRVVVSNPDVPAGVHGTDHTFTTQASTGATVILPDDRGYEQVTPAVKGDGALGAVHLGLSPGFQASINGDKLGYTSTTPFPGSQAGLVGNYIGSRGVSGWSTQSLNPPQATATVAVASLPIGAFSSDLSKAILTDGQASIPRGPVTGQDVPPLVSGEPANNQNVFLRDDLTGSYQLMNVTPAGFTPDQAFFSDASADLSHVVFSSVAQLTADAVPGAGNLYQWFGGAVSLVGQIPIPPATTCGAGGQSCSATDAALGSGVVGYNPGALGAVSSDGSKIFFQEPGSAGDGQLYVREGGVRTVEYSASQKTNGTGPGGNDPNGPRPALYWPASSDGSRALFSSCLQLTNDSTASTLLTNSGGGCLGALSQPSGQDLYQYDTTSGVLTDLTVDHNSNPIGADVQGVVGASADGSYVYFVANGVLAGGAKPGDCINQRSHGVDDPSSTCSLYVAHGGTTRFIATLSGHDALDWAGLFTGRVTPDGTHLAFNSTRSLTGYDNTPAAPGDCTSGYEDGFGRSTCSEVYLYDALTSQLVCASCNPSGARPVGPASIAAGYLTSHPYLPRNLSVDGSRLFFDSQDALVAGDTNGRQDVYEYEGGRPYLISAGTGSSDAAFVDASLSGGDVFFMTSAPLVGQDVDQSLDIYDARVGGGFPFSPAPGSCVGDACRPAGSGAAPGVSPGSAAFVGPGDPAAPAAGSVASRGVRVLAKRAGGRGLTLRVSVPGRGRLNITGAGVRRVSRSLSRAGVYRIVFGLTAAERRVLKRAHRVRLTVRVRFTPAGGGTSVLSVAIVDKA